MKIRNKLFHPLRYISTTIVFIFGLITIISSGGGDDGNGVDLNNGLLSGAYHWSTVEFEWDHMNIGSVDIDADGQGTITILGQTVKYEILAADRTLSILPGSTAEDEFGIVSSDGDVALITDAQFIDPNDQRDVETHIVIRKSTNIIMTPARMSGEFIVNQIGQNASGYYTSQLLVVLDSGGSGTWTILNHSQGQAGSGTLTFSVANDGTFTLDNGFGADTGIISPDTNVLAITDGDMLDGDNEQVFSIGVRKSTSAPVLSSDNYQLHFIGYDISNPYPIGPQFAARWNAVEDAANLEFDATAIVDSRGIASGSTASIAHSAVATDGTFVAEGTDLGIVSPDGKYFAIVETEQFDDFEMKIGFAID